MRKIIIAWLWLTLIVVPSCFTEQSQGIHTIKSFNEFNFDNIAQGTIVVFDVDGVLINPGSKLFWGKMEKEHGQWIGQLYSNVFERAKNPPFFYLSKMLEKETPVLIEPIVVSIISKLQNRGITVIALTTTNTGSCFDIPSLPIWRFNKLKEVGIDFSTVKIANMEFTELPAKSSEGDIEYPIFFNGILFTSDSSKGAVITAFFEHTKLKPSRVIFFDDRMSNLESVSQAMNKLGIPFSGYEYLGESYMPGKLDKEVASYQLNYVVDNEQWLNEDEAQALLKKCKKESSKERIKGAVCHES